jgi:peptidoglycan-associated lipoprotein
MMKKIILGIVLLNLLVACSSNKPKEKVSEPAPAPEAAAAVPAAASAETGSADNASTSTAPVAAESASSVAPDSTASAAETSVQENGSAYFPFDVDAVQEADRAAVQAHGAYLGKNKTAKVRVEGNADERGSSEYNLGLGQRRANNVKKLLIMSGAGNVQIETVSFGEEKPRCAEHNESCWSQNRRADIIYTAK